MLPHLLLPLANQSLGEGEREEGRGGEEESLRGWCHCLAREIVSENHTVEGINSISGQDTFWSGKAGGQGWLGGVGMGRVMTPLKDQFINSGSNK